MPQGTYTLDDVAPQSAAPAQAGKYSADDIADASPPAERTWLDSAGDFAKGLWSQVNPITGVKGLAQATSHPIQTYMADAGNRQEILDQAEEDFKSGNYGRGVVRSLYGIIPFLGPQMNQAGTDIGTGKVAQGLGESIGMGLSMTLPSKIGDVTKLTGPLDTEAAATRWYQSALKPSTTANPAKVANAISGGLENAIPISKGGLEKLADLTDDLNSKIAAEIASRPNAPINKFAVASRLGDTAKQFSTQVNPIEDLNAIGKSGNEFLENQPVDIPASQAQALKQGTYKQLSGRAYGELGSATIESQKALARGLKEELANAFPELSDLNAQDSKLLDLQGMLQRAVNRISNHQMVGIGTPIMGAGVKAATGSTGIAGAAALAKAVFDDPYIKSQVAIALNKASKGGITIPTAAARYAGYVNALGNVSTSPSPGDQGSQ